MLADPTLISETSYEERSAAAQNHVRRMGNVGRKSPRVWGAHLSQGFFEKNSHRTSENVHPLS